MVSSGSSSSTGRVMPTEPEESRMYGAAAERNMATLVEGHQYGLSSRTAASDGKTVVYLKLTDSALKAIDEYQSNKSLRTSNEKPSIRLGGNNGVLQIPCRSSNNESGVTAYKLNLSQLPGDPNGSFDCVQQDTNSLDNELELIGSMVHKIQVLAAEDVYKQTRQKMAQAEEAHKNICTKEIKPGSQYRSKRVKKVLKPSDLRLPELSQDNTPPTARSITNLPNSAKVPTPPSVTQRPTANVAPLQRSMPTSLSKKSAQPTNKTVLNSALNRNIQNQALNKNVLNQTGANRLISNSQNNKQLPSSSVLNKPYRNRIIHLLAVRPYKKPELLARLHRDGIKEKDRNSLGTILQQVAVMNPRDNTFNLAKHMYSEVDVNWPAYTDNDKQLLQKRLPSTPTHSPNVSPVQSTSPSSSQNSQNSQHSQKRPSTSEDSSAPVKKAKLVETTLVDSSNRKAHHNGTIKQDADSSQSRKENHLVIGNTSPDSLATSTSDTPDYVNRYTVIRSNEQRQKYKADFNLEYEEYRHNHAGVEQVSKKFTRLEEIYRKAPEGSKDFENIKNQILHEYKTLKSDPKYIKKKRRLEYLHKKLAHIKKLILEYDQVQLQVHDS